eukprot:scaffold4097_cov306-Pinguiococcus_pyrenoidosus.AAC.7
MSTHTSRCLATSQTRLGDEEVSSGGAVRRTPAGNVPFAYGTAGIAHGCHRAGVHVLEGKRQLLHDAWQVAREAEALGKRSTRTSELSADRVLLALGNVSLVQVPKPLVVEAPISIGGGEGGALGGRGGGGSEAGLPAGSMWKAVDSEWKVGDCDSREHGESREKSAFRNLRERRGSCSDAVEPEERGIDELLRR